MAKNVTLIGNPNSGKSSLFNQLTGLSQKIGNYPGVTVERKIGKFKLPDGTQANVTDLPGAYSLFPSTEDEKIATREILKNTLRTAEDITIYVADITKLNKHLLLLTQLKSLQKKLILCLNMADLSTLDGEQLIRFFQEKFNIPTLLISAKTGRGIEELKNLILHYPTSFTQTQKDIFFDPSNFTEKDQVILSETHQLLPTEGNDFVAFVAASHHQYLVKDYPALQSLSEKIAVEGYSPTAAQIQDTLYRYSKLDPLSQQIAPSIESQTSITQTLDKVLTHRIYGPIIFLVIMLLVFQAIFAWAQIPMEWIDGGFGQLTEIVANTLPNHWLTDLLTEGIIAGIGGIIIFIPQIALLFLLIGILEETGYMARVVFLLDNTMQKIGMNGRSVVALVSGGACAIPAIMSTRTIAGWKERLITIMVTPLISCSARLPVYALLIAMVVPYTFVAGIFNLQGLAFALMYFLGGILAVIIAFILKKIIKADTESFLLMELPEYKAPNWKNVGINVYNKVKAFIIEAGKIILVISVVLWFLASYGPEEKMAAAEVEAERMAIEDQLSDSEQQDLLATLQLENSYAGIMGKTIEPIIRPIGFDWKIGISLITSFAAREVFVGTMATIYSVGNEDNTASIQEKMKKETFLDTGKKVYTPATIWSLLLFYAFAMQCMSTLAVVRKETKSWKWPMIQFIYLTVLAYGASWFIYTILS